MVSIKQKNRMKMISQLREIVSGPKTDDADEEAHEEADHKTDKQLDTTDMPDLESEESAEQRGQVLKNTDTKSSA